jgi:two-component system, LytTR family, response regulator AlgR
MRSRRACRWSPALGTGGSRLRVLIVDDEPLARQRLRCMVQELGGYEVVGEAADGSAAINESIRLMPEVVLIDVRMPARDGLDVCEELQRLAVPPVVIFVTAFANHAVAAFDREAIDYLLKPVRRERLGEALARARRRWIERQGPAIANAGEMRYLASTVRGVLRRVPVAEIRYLQADNKYVTACWPGGELLLEQSLKGLETDFAELLLRVHRNTLVGVRHVEAVTRDEEGNSWVRLRDIPQVLPVSRRLVAEVRRRLRIV